MDPSPTGVAGVFDRAADTYDDVGVPWFRPIADGLVRALAPRSGERVLDVGCGRGAVLLPLAEAVGMTGQALGIDLSPRMVALAAEGTRDLSQVRVRVADAMDPGRPAASYDLVAASLVLFFLPDPLAALRCWTELLVTGGRLGITTFGAQDPRWLRLDTVFSPYLPSGLVDARTSGGAGPFATDSGVEGLLTAAGLVDVRTTHGEAVATFTGPAQWEAFSWSLGQRAMWEAVPVSERGRVMRTATDVIEGMRDPDGRIRFTQQVRYTIGHRPGAR